MSAVTPFSLETDVHHIYAAAPVDSAADHPAMLRRNVGTRCPMRNDFVPLTPGPR